jgi:hypothetical protein
MPPVAAHAYRYGSAVYGRVPYGGNSPAVIIPTRNVSGIIFLVSNDRYQVISCSYGGSLSFPPEFRYWYAGPPPWAEDLAQDGFIPPWYSEDEKQAIPVASLELPFRKFSAGQEGIIKDVVVEFIPRPAILTGNTVTTGGTCSFSVWVEAQGVRAYTQGTGATTIGMVTSPTFMFSEDVTGQGSSVWPNIRTEIFPTRIDTHVRSARVVLSNIQLCEILSVSLVGTSLPARDV